MMRKGFHQGRSPLRKGFIVEKSLSGKNLLKKNLIVERSPFKGANSKRSKVII
jgi:hypothetical protein